MVFTIWSRMPCTMDAIVITVATPITTPRMVSDERSRDDMIADMAMPMFWPSARGCSRLIPHASP